MYTKIFFIIGVMMSCNAYGAAGNYITDEGRFVYTPERMVDVFIRLRLFEDGLRTDIQGRLPVSRAQKGLCSLTSYVREEIRDHGIYGIDEYVVKVVAPQSNASITDEQYRDTLSGSSPHFKVYVGLPENIP